MRVEDLTVSLRPRSHWEAVDLGMRLVRTHARALLPVQLGVVLPLMAAGLALGWLSPWLMVVVIYGVSVAGDRALVQVLGAKVFGATVDRPARSAWSRPGLMLLEVCLSRLDPRRIATLGVDVLEGIRGNQAMRRKGQVAGNVGGVAAMVSLMGRVVELGLWSGLASLGDVLSTPPPGAEADATGPLSLLEGLLSPEEVLVQGALMAGVMLLVRPFVVGAGFALYLNHRIHTEGWDLEVGLRRLVLRLAPSAGRVALVLLALSSLWPGSILAQQGAPTPEGLDPQEVVEEVLADEVFGGVRTRQRLVPVVDPFDRLRAPPPEVDLDLPFDPVEATESPQGEAAEAVPAVFAALLLLLPLVGAILWRSRPRREAQAVIRLLPPEPVEQHHDVVSHARRAFSEDAPDRALGMLYGAALDRLSGHLGLRLPPGATERSSVRALHRRQPGERATWFGELARARVRSAYGHSPVDPDEFEALCQGWLRHIGPLGGLLLVLLTSPGCHFETVDELHGPEGPARTNPHLAAERLVEGMGRDVRGSLGIPGRLEPGGVAVLWSDDAEEQDQAWEALRSWVAQGGVLVVPLATPPLGFVMGTTPEGFEEGPAGGIAHSLGLSLRTVSAEAPVQLFDARGYDTFELVLLPAYEPVGESEGARGWWGPDAAGERVPFLYAVAEPWGAGQVVVVSSVLPFTNDHLGEGEHASLLWDLISAYGAPDGPVTSVRHLASASLSTLVWKHAPLFVLGLLLALILATWRALVRDGPPLPEPVSERRALLEHVDAVGRWTWRTGRSPRLLRALRARLHEAAPWLDRARDPVSALAERTGRPHGEVAAAFEDLDPFDRPGFLRAARTLRALHADLTASPTRSPSTSGPSSGAQP